MFTRISGEQAKELLDSGKAVCVDIRDENAFKSGRIPGARHLTQENLQDFLTEADPDTPLLVCCYHGVSSQSAAQFLFEKGFEQVSSIDGGFAAWQAAFPVETG